MKSRTISEFRGEYAFLSNFFESPIKYNGIRYLNSEAAFQASKILDRSKKEEFMLLSAKEAKKLGRKVKLREDWETVKDGIMEEIIHEKFSDCILAKELLDTGDAELVEGNTWNDTYWGVCNGKGRNRLGEILMKERERISKEKSENLPVR